MKLALVVILASGVARADTLIASEHDGTLVVSKLAGDKLETAYEEPQSGALEYAFSDAHTLWVLRAKAGKFTIGKIDFGSAGNRAPERVLTRDDWKPTTRTSPGFAPHLLITTSGQAWLARCVDTFSDLVGECPTRYLRVDGSAPVADALDDVAIEAPSWWSRTPKRLAAPPKGFSLAQTASTLACKGPNKRWSLALGTRSTLAIRWLSEDPPIVAFDVVLVQSGKPSPPFNLLDGPYDRYASRDASSDDGTGDFMLEACTTFLRQVIAVAPDVIATTEGERAWKLRRGTQVLATFTASRVVAAPF